MLPGHSYLPNDRDFGNIELAKKKKQAIYTPDDWYALVQEARRRNPFSVCEMKSEDFVSIKKSEVAYRQSQDKHTQATGELVGYSLDKSH